MKSFILYPEKEVIPFLKKNIIKEKNLKKSILLGKMLDQKNTLIVEQDSERNVRFNPTEAQRKFNAKQNSDEIPMQPNECPTKIQRQSIEHPSDENPKNIQWKSNENIAGIHPTKTQRAFIENPSDVYHTSKIEAPIIEGGKEEEIWK